MRSAQTIARATIVALLAVALALLSACTAPSPRLGARVPCSHYDTQVQAQHAADSADPDRDGRYCETLPCPCAGGAGHTTTASAGSSASSPKRCESPAGVQMIAMSSTRYPRIKAHAEAAIAAGWPRVLVINRPGAAARRARLLARIPTREGYDRDEYPPAVGRGRGEGLEQGANPRGWQADVQYVPSSENRAHGSLLGVRLGRFCGGTRFEYAWY